jgi:prepilin-type N-terminal cleavage/methylation domain-containing protein
MTKPLSLHHKMKVIQRQLGFTLVEMAVVLVILGFLITAFLLPLKAQRDVSFQLETQRTLENAKKAIIGYAQTNGRLPCPATNNGGAFPDDTGSSNPIGSGACVLPVGFLPATTLGIQPTDEQGFAVDAWNNRIRYAVTVANGDAFTTTNGMDSVGIAALTPNLRVCPSSNCATSLITNAPIVIYSLGPTGGEPSGGLDETENLDIDNDFVSHTPTSAGVPNGEFDHIVTWLSPYVLYNAMIEAGQIH